MFQALNAHHQEANYIDAASGIVLSVSGRSVHQQIPTLHKHMRENR